MTAIIAASKRMSKDRRRFPSPSPLGWAQGTTSSTPLRGAQVTTSPSFSTVTNYGKIIILWCAEEFGVAKLPKQTMGHIRAPQELTYPTNPYIIMQTITISYKNYTRMVNTKIEILGDSNDLQSGKAAIVRLISVQWYVMRHQPQKVQTYNPYTPSATTR